MSQRPPEDNSTPAPLDDGVDGSRTGVGAQTALRAMLKKRSMRASRDPDPEPPLPEARDPAAE